MKLSHIPRELLERSARAVEDCRSLIKERRTLLRRVKEITRPPPYWPPFHISDFPCNPDQSPS